MKFCDGQGGAPRSWTRFAAAFAVVGEEQEMVADQETMALPKRFSRDPWPIVSRPCGTCIGPCTDPFSVRFRFTRGS